MCDLTTIHQGGSVDPVGRWKKGMGRLKEERGRRGGSVHEKNVPSFFFGSLISVEQFNHARYLDTCHLAIELRCSSEAHVMHGVHSTVDIVVLPGALSRTLHHFTRSNPIIPQRAINQPLRDASYSPFPFLPSSTRVESVPSIKKESLKQCRASHKSLHRPYRTGKLQQVDSPPPHCLVASF